MREDSTNNKSSDDNSSVNINHVIDDQHVTSSIDPVNDNNNEVTIATANDEGDDGSNMLVSSHHDEVVQPSSNNSILIPYSKKGLCVHKYVCVYVCVQLEGIKWTLSGWLNQFYSCELVAVGIFCEYTCVCTCVGQCMCVCVRACVCVCEHTIQLLCSYTLYIHTYMLYMIAVLFIDDNILPATLQCTDNDLAYLERMANIKLIKELTVSTHSTNDNTVMLFTG